MAMTIRGAEATVRWVYHRAAELGSWELTVDDTVGTVTAKVTAADDFKLAQQGLVFRVDRQNGPAFIWPVQSLHVADGMLTARVSLQE